MLTQSFFDRLVDIVPPPESRKPLTTQTFLVDFLPVVISFYGTAMLVLLPGTLRARLALLPWTLWSAFHAATTLDIVKVYNEPGLAYWNQGFCIAMLSIAMRAIEWSFRSKPLKRMYPSSSSSQSRKSTEEPNEDPDLKKAAWDAVELMFNLRGCGWDWSKGLYIPPGSYTHKSTSAFVLDALFATIKNTLLVDVVQYTIQSMSPTTFGSSAGGTIFDPSLPPYLRYTRSSFICFLACFIVYFAILAYYELFSCIGVIVFRQHPSQWPQLFYDPWWSSSLAELWAKRWHQIFRQSFISIGGTPLYFLFGPVGRVFGAFLASGILHQIGLWGMGRGTEFWSVGGFFLMMAVGIVLEDLWRRVTGTRVSGRGGWLWTMAWTIGWSNLLVDAWLRRGMAGAVFFPQALRPSSILVGSIHKLYTSQ